MAWEGRPSAGHTGSLGCSWRLLGNVDVVQAIGNSLYHRGGLLVPDEATGQRSAVSFIMLRPLMPSLGPAKARTALQPSEAPSLTRGDFHVDAIDQPAYRGKRKIFEDIPGDACAHDHAGVFCVAAARRGIETVGGDLTFSQRIFAGHQRSRSSPPCPARPSTSRRLPHSSSPMRPS
jgi:hypothetical protein